MFFGGRYHFEFGEERKMIGREVGRRKSVGVGLNGFFVQVLKNSEARKRVGGEKDIIESTHIVGGVIGELGFASAGDVVGRDERKVVIETLVCVDTVAVVAKVNMVTGNFAL